MKITNDIDNKLTSNENENVLYKSNEKTNSYKNYKVYHLNTVLIFILGALGGLLFGFDTGVISGASPLIENAFKLNISQTSFVTSSVLIGSSVGALSIGTLSDKFGRKKMLIVASILFILGSILSAFAVGFVSMCMARIILGLAVGGASGLTPSYLAELAEAEHRGTITGMFQFMITTGILLAYIINIAFLHHNLLGWSDWRWMLGSALVPAILLFIGSIIIPESPRYLVQIGKINEAEEVLDILRDNTKSDPKNELNDIKNIIKQEKSNKGSIHELFKVASPSVFVAIFIMLFQQLVGINSIVYYLPQIFIKAFNFPDSKAIWISIGMEILSFITTILSVILMDKFNRKSFLLFGSITMAICLVIISIMSFTMNIKAAAIPTIILIAVYHFAFSISWGPIAWILIAEIFPLNVRGIGNSIGSAANWIGDFLVTQFFLIILAMFHNKIGGPFMVFAVFSVLSIFFVIFFVPETRGKTLEQIEMELRHRHHLLLK